jgi:hypothetical protein
VKEIKAEQIKMSRALPDSGKGGWPWERRTSPIHYSFAYLAYILYILSLHGSGSFTYNWDFLGVGHNFCDYCD